MSDVAKNPWGGVTPILTKSQLVAARRLELRVEVEVAERRLGRELTAWQREVAVAILMQRDFASSGRGSGKTFLADFLIDSGLCEEDAVRG